MSDFSFIVVGIIAALHGVNALEHARAGRHFKPSSVIGAIIAGYLVSEHGSRLLSADGWLVLTGWALLFDAAAPVLGYVIYGRGGRIGRLLMRTAGFLVLTAIMTVLWLRRLEDPFDALMAGGLTAVLPLLPWSGVGRCIRRSRQRREEQRRQRREEGAQERELRRQHVGLNELRELRRLARRSSRTLQAQERRLVALERGEHRERARLDALREEAIEQVRLLREAEVEGIKAGDETFVKFHPHYGFLMAEAWRVLRAEISSGMRPAALEHDAFFFQVIEGLLEAPDFERRYLHETGQTAMAAVNRYLSGRAPFSQMQAEIVDMDWMPELLAPIPVRGELVPGLLEAWLVPHRRRQDLDWRFFCAGDHPRQSRLNEFFDQLEIELPTREEWRQLWDEHPEHFV